MIDLNDLKRWSYELRFDNSGTLTKRAISKIKKFIAIQSFKQLGKNILYPDTIGIELTNRCNLRCIECARNYWDAQKNKFGDMSFDFFVDKVEPILHKGMNVQINGYGESLLNKDIFKILDRCNKKGCFVQLYTNGSLFTPENIKKLMRVDQIVFSIDGIESCKKIRGVSSEKIFDNIRQINKIKAKKNLLSPTIAINFCAMRDNIKELPGLVKIASTLKIDYFSVRHLNIYSKNLISQSLQHKDNLRLAERYFKKAQDIAKRNKLILSIPPLENKFLSCTNPFNVVWIKWNGDVIPCCLGIVHEKNTISVGNLNKSSFDEIWNNNMINHIRRSLLDNKNFHPYCETCPERYCCLEFNIRHLK
ncbi:radical SAM protein [Candidatus Pacearchaeota archaeon]|nr:radical SAM protein [Candidatus Pacearchaeota archaeon]